MNNILYMTISESLESDSGINKKIKSQIRAMENIGYNVHLSGRTDKYYSFTIKNVRTKLLKNQNRLSIFRSVCSYVEKHNIDIIYIRKITFDLSFLLFLRSIKKSNIKIYIEIPTYPYDYEYENTRQKTLNFIDRFFRVFLFRYVDYFVTFSVDKSIFNVPCINISNGISNSDFILSTEPVFKVAKTYNFITVSSLRNWHAVDRFIESMSKCSNKDYQLHLHVVGPENDYSKDLKKLAIEHNLKNITFYGFLDGEKLNKLYSKCQFGLGSLGRHRSGVETLSSLKNREYSAKGLHVIYSENDLDFDNMDFVYRISSDEKIFSVDKIIEWYEKSTITSVEIINFSKQFSWDNQMKKVFKMDIEDDI